MAYLFLALTILLIACGQIAQKFASRCVRPGAGIHAVIQGLAVSPAFWLSALLLSAGLLAWLTALSTIEVSKAYPLLSISFVITALLSRLFVQEYISRRRWVGIGLVTVGAAIMLAAS